MIIKLKEQLSKLGIELDIDTGHIFYHENFIPPRLNFELIFVRHGETYGNCGQSTETGKIDHDKVKHGIKNKEHRIYQGDVDTEINRLTEYGKQQALEVAEKLHCDYLKKGWEPDVILISPLTRAKETALPFVQKNNFQNRMIIYEGVKEMNFGSWDNQRVSDIQPDDPCHLFYREQHALVKNDGATQKGESFCELLLRAHNVLNDLNEKYSGKKILVFSHSMFGEALRILIGKGQRIEDGEHLAFDGKRKDGTYYTMPNAEPIVLQSEQKYTLGFIFS